MSRRTIPIKDLNQVQAVDPDDLLALQPKDGSPAVSVKASLLGGGDYCGPTTTVDNEIMRADGVAGCLQGSQSWVDDEGIVTATSYRAVADSTPYIELFDTNGFANQNIARLQYAPNGDIELIAVADNGTTETNLIKSRILAGGGRAALSWMEFGNNTDDATDYYFIGPNGQITAEGFLRVENGANILNGLDVSGGADINSGDLDVLNGHVNVSGQTTSDLDINSLRSVNVNRWLSFWYGNQGSEPSPSFSAGTLTLYRSYSKYTPSGPTTIHQITGSGDGGLKNDGILFLNIIASEANPVTFTDGIWDLYEGSGGGGQFNLRMSGSRNLTITKQTLITFMFDSPVWEEVSRSGWAGETNLQKSGELAAAGSDLATATEVPFEVSRITSASANQGVRLPKTQYTGNGAGVGVTLYNDTAEAVNVYPDSSGSIDGGGTGVVDSRQLQPGENRTYSIYEGAGSNNDWRTNYTAIVPPQAEAGSNLPQSVEGVALSGVNSQGADVLAHAATQVTTAPLTSSVTLPVSALSGQKLLVVNATANPVEVYPPSGGTIDTGAANAADSTPIAANSAREYAGFGSSLNWYTV